MTQEAQQQEGISLNDLALMVNIIDTCTKRGAFEGNELATIGAIRNKIETFVKANMPKQEETETTEETPAE